MKKLIILFAPLLLLSVFCGNKQKAATTIKSTTDSYAALASNESVSFQNLADAVTYGDLPGTGTTVTPSSELVTKADVSTYVGINTSNVYYSALSSGEVVAKRDLTPYYYSYTVYMYTGYDGGTSGGWANSTDACNYATSGLCTTYATNTVYSPSSSLSTSASIYWYDGYNYQPWSFSVNTGGCSSPYNYTTGYWAYYPAGNSAIELNHSGTGQIITMTSCVTYYTYVLNNSGTGQSSCSAARSGSTGGPGVYSNTGSLINGATYLYTDAGLTTPYNGGGNWYCITISGTKWAFQLSSTGLVTNLSSSC